MTDVEGESKMDRWIEKETDIEREKAREKEREREREKGREREEVKIMKGNNSFSVLGLRKIEKSFCSAVLLCFRTR